MILTTQGEEPVEVDNQDDVRKIKQICQECNSKLPECTEGITKGVINCDGLYDKILGPF